MKIHGNKDMKNTVKNVKNKAEDAISNSRNEIVESSKDWMNYIKEHPLQSALFGIIGYYALKGLLKS